ncbi:MAG: DUF924 family protein [Aureibaculum sp.]|nr:DUF924 family protein [Aureibaculum sp.]
MSTKITPTPTSIIEFWYSEKVKSKWFNSSIEFDKELKSNYEYVWEDALRGEFSSWRDSPDGCLAIAIILDQFPLNMFRGEVKSFSSEAMAVKVAKHAVENGFDKNIDKDKVSFLYMPLMHSENMDDQNLAVKLFEEAELIENARFAKHHRDIVKKYGRFPHRNKILNRESSKEEIEYLNSDGAFTG